MKAIQIATFTALLLNAFIIGATLSSAAHAQNAPLNYNNSPLNFENSLLNYIATNGVYDSQGSRTGYTTVSPEGVTNIYSQDGNRQG